MGVAGGPIASTRDDGVSISATLGLSTTAALELVADASAIAGLGCDGDEGLGCRSVGGPWRSCLVGPAMVTSSEWGECAAGATTLALN